MGSRRVSGCAELLPIFGRQAKHLTPCIDLFLTLTLYWMRTRCMQEAEVTPIPRFTNIGCDLSERHHIIFL